MSARRRLVVGIAGLVAAGLVSGLSGCGAKPAPAAPPPPTVGVVKSRKMTVPIVNYPNGTTRALEQVTIRARVRGFLIERHFEEGATVKKGDLLLVIDEVPYKVALESAHARVAEAEAAIRKAEQSKAREVATAQVALDEAQLGLAQIEEGRSRSLLQRNAGTREDLDKTQADRKKAEAQVAADRAQRDQAAADYEVGILTTKAQLAAAQASARDAELNLGYCRMYAPIDGRIGQAVVKVGNLVGPGGEGGSTTELATIQQLNPMGVEVRVSSRYLGRATQLTRGGLKTRLTRPGLEGDLEHPFEGEFYFIDNTVDETTGTFLAKARIPNPESTLLPGEYVKLRVEVDRIVGATVVPVQAVMETDQGPVVYLVDKEGKVAIQSVVAEQSYEGLRVLTKGLGPDQDVIVEGLQMIRPGIKVNTQPATLARPTDADTRPDGTGDGSEEQGEAATARPEVSPKADADATAPAPATGGDAPKRATPKSAGLTPGGERSAVVTQQRAEDPKAPPPTTAATPAPPTDKPDPAAGPR